MRVEDVVNKVFTRSFMGYDIEQVDLFLDEVIERFEQYESERKEMLIAMEYLLDKLENEQKLPIAEMKKAIHSGKPEKKRSGQSERITEGNGQKSTKKKKVSAEGAQLSQKEKQQTARSIARGTQPPKPVRAPKVARVSVPQQTLMQQMQEATFHTKPDGRQDKAQEKGTTAEQQVEKYEEEAPVMENWLDELLVNLVEREKTGYGVPLDSMETPNCNNGDVETKNGYAEQSASENETGEDEEMEGEGFPEGSDRGE